jgi:hypothetical protein
MEGAVKTYLGAEVLRVWVFGFPRRSRKFLTKLKFPLFFWTATWFRTRTGAGTTLSESIIAERVTPSRHTCSDSGARAWSSLGVPVRRLRSMPGSSATGGRWRTRKSHWRLTSTELNPMIRPG